MRVTAGRPDAEELAAVTAVIVGLLATQAVPAAPPPPAWTRPETHQPPRDWTSS